MFKKGHTIIELMIGVAVFSLFLYGVFSIISIGLKNYRLLDSKNEARAQAEVAIGRIYYDLLLTDITSLVAGTLQEDYMVFQTAVDPNDNEFQKNDKRPLWQGYILYYTYPRDPNNVNRKLYRKYVPYGPTGIAKKMTNIDLYLTDTANSGENIRLVAKSIYDINISVNSNEYIVDVDLTTWQKFSEKRLAYQKDFSDNVGNVKINLTTSVMPRNTEY